MSISEAKVRDRLMVLVDADTVVVNGRIGMRQLEEQLYTALLCWFESSDVDEGLSLYDWLDRRFVDVSLVGYSARALEHGVFRAPWRKSVCSEERVFRNTVSWSRMRPESACVVVSNAVSFAELVGSMREYEVAVRVMFTPRVDREFAECVEDGHRREVERGSRWVY